jgi:predicted HTH transcriptional regulator
MRIGTNGTNDTNGTKVKSDGILTETNQKIIEMLRRDEKSTQKKISEELGVSLRTVKRNMAALQENGVIVRVGSNKSGYWKVNRESEY